jgi:hypothetical protein
MRVGWQSAGAAIDRYSTGQLAATWKVGFVRRTPCAQCTTLRTLVPTRTGLRVKYPGICRFPEQPLRRSC